MLVRETYAQDVARQVLAKLPKVLPVDVLGICEACEYVVRFHDEALDKNEEAVTFCIRGRYVIILKKVTASCRLRWTIAHELGHILLGHFAEYDLSFNGADKLGRSVAWGLNREANRFAEELLMPEDFIRNNLWRGPDYLRRFCDVSRQSLAIRLKTLGLEPPSGAAAVAETAAVYETD